MARRNKLQQRVWRCQGCPMCPHTFGGKYFEVQSAEAAEVADSMGHNMVEVTTELAPASSHSTKPKAFPTGDNTLANATVVDEALTVSSDNMAL